MSDIGLDAGPCEPWDVTLCCDHEGVPQTTIDRMVMAVTNRVIAQSAVRTTYPKQLRNSIDCPSRKLRND